MRRRFVTKLALGLTALALVAAACGKDDGGTVRDVGGSESESGSASASGSGSATGSASASGTGAGEEEKCEPANPELASETEVAVVLTEWEVKPAVESVEAGAVEFEIANEGADGHEFVVIRGDDPAALPMTDDDVADLEALEEQGALVGEVETFPGGQHCEGTFELTPGSYILLCNLVEQEENGEIENHFKEGMVTTFTVT